MPRSKGIKDLPIRIIKPPEDLSDQEAKELFVFERAVRAVLPETLHRRLMAYCKSQGLSDVGPVLEEALDRFLPPAPTQEESH